MYIDIHMAIYIVDARKVEFGRPDLARRHARHMRRHELSVGQLQATTKER